MSSLFFDSREERSGGFGGYEESLQYQAITKDMVRIKLNGTDRDILSLLGICPLLPTSCIVDIVGEEAYKRVKLLFDHGYLSRFSAASPNGFVKSVFYLASNTYAFVRQSSGKVHTPGVIDKLSYVNLLETAALSKWAAYALKYQPKGDVELLCFREKTMEHPYLEAILEKHIDAGWFRRGIPCRFHVVCCPKDDHITAFWGALDYFESLVKREEAVERYRNLHSYVVIVCQSISRMEHLAVELEKRTCPKTQDGLSKEHFLYSLETDGMIELGPFKFMHSIDFSETTICHEQVAFR